MTINVHDAMNDRKYYGVIIVASLVMAYGISVVLHAPLSGLVAYFWDDSFFYLKIAHNISTGSGSTFDGVNPTNGYHPLYMVYLSLFSMLVPIVGENGLLAVFVLDTLTMLLGLYFLVRFLAKANVRPGSALIAVLLVMAVIGWRDYGLEIRLLFTLVWGLVLLLMESDFTENNYKKFLAGVVCGLVILTRLDAVVLVAFVILWSFWRQMQGDGGWKTARILYGHGLLLIAPMVVMVAMYYFYNWVNYGHAMTISSWLKSGSAATPWFVSLLSGGLSGTQKLHVLLVANAFISVMVFGGLLIRKRELMADKMITILFVLSGYALLYLTVVPALTDLARWYLFFPATIVFAADVILLDRYLISKFSQFTTYAVVLFIGTISLLSINHIVIHRPLLYGGWTIQHIRMGQWIDENLPIDSRIFQVDESGMVGYFSNRSLINGDGLVNSWEYTSHIKNRSIPEYLAEKRVDYLIWDEYKNEPVLRIAIPLWNKIGMARYHVLRLEGEPVIVTQFGRLILVDVRNAKLAIEPETVGVERYSHVGGFIEPATAQ